MSFVEEPNNIKRSKTLSLIPIEKIQIVKVRSRENIFSLKVK